MRATHSNRPIEILLVEDSPDDVEFTRAALEESKVRNNLHVVNDGVEAMAFMNREGEYEDVPRPDLVLLDLNLPRMNGQEVLQALKKDPGLRSIPVVVLTISDADEDILGAYEAHAACYIRKPVDFEQFRGIVRSIEHFWFTIVRLPSGGEGGDG